MKKTVTVVLILFLACIVGYGGAGVNYINYCCHECAVQGVDAVVNDLCCETHGHDHVNFMNEKGEVFRHDGDCLNCGLKRVKFEWTDDTDDMPVIQVPSFDLSYLSSDIIQSLIPAVPVYSHCFVPLDGPPILCPRVYLSLLTTLLI
jgi:hypothetical protein